MSYYSYREDKILPKEIELYNTYFGDCYIIKDGQSNLIVDFGIHNCSNVDYSKYTNRFKLIETIADDIKKNNSRSVLITHFHTDHISGLIHMYRSAKMHYKNFFNKIYIPNVWENPFALVTSLLEEMVLEFQLKKTRLPGTLDSFFDLVEFLCINVGNVELLSRGVSFENERYLTLWPPKHISESEYKNSLANLNIPNQLIKDLYSLSEAICDYMQRIINGKNNANFDFEVINSFRDTYKGIKTKYNMLNVDVKQLNKLGHHVNVVFHNKVCGNENVLCTGDAETFQMKKIACATDYQLHHEYKFIKVPHHGTPNHYYDFSKYSPKYIIIPNGRVNGHIGDDAYKIDSRYGDLTANHICSNSNNCSCCINGCISSVPKCSGCQKIVYPEYCKTIT